MTRFEAFVCFAAAGVAASVAAYTFTPAAAAPNLVEWSPPRASLPVMAPVTAAEPQIDPPGIQPAPRAPADEPTGFEALEQTLADCDPALRDRLLTERLPALTLRDPARAARFAELLADARLRELALLQVAMSWARGDADAAVHWAESLADPVMRDAAVTDIALALAETNPARAVALRQRFADTSMPDNTLVNLAHQWAEQDFEAALAWANAQPAGALRDQVLQRLVFVQAAAGEFTAAAELARSLIAAPRIRAEALAAVAQQES